VAWNLVTWALKLPSSSSHALVGGVVGAAIAGIGSGAVKGDTLVEKVIVPGLLSPFIAGLVAIAGTLFAYLIFPGAAIIAAAAFEAADLFGQGNTGPLIVGLIAAGLAAVLYVVVQRTPVRANDLDRSRSAGEAPSRTEVAVPA
jgi:phosphate/sulfate permease